MPIRPDAAPFHAGQGRVGVLFLHGFTGSPVSLRGWAEGTAEAGHRVALPRLPGHGTDWREMRHVAWTDWYDTAEREFNELQRGCDHVFVAALSMGGALALRLAERRSDEVAGLMLVNPAITASNPAARFAGLLKHVVPSIGGIANDAMATIDEGAYDRTPLAGVHTMYQLWSDVRSYLDLVTCPYVLFRSRTDHVVPRSSAEIIGRQTSSLEATEHVLERSYHVATMDHDADFIVDTSLTFITRHTS